MKKFSVNILAFAVGLVVNHNTFSQEVTAADLNENLNDDAAIVEEEVTVTGSRIKRDTFSTPMPMFSINKEDIISIGSNALTDVLLEVPSIVSGLSQTNTTTNLQNSGLSSVDLRNLDDNRTLVLIDGRRTVSNSANGNRVSLGTIPANFVERVEVITGGASAVYGSDAVAGVVNIITEKNHEGVEINARFGEGRDGAFDDKTFDISFGGKFNDNKGYVFASVNYDDESGIRAEDWDRALIQASWDYVDGVNVFETADGDQPARDLTVDQYADLSSDPDGGRFDGSNFWYNDEGLQQDFVTNRDGFDFRADDDILIPRERLNAAIKIDYQFSDDLEAFFTTIYSKVDTDNLREPEGDDYNDPHTLFDPATGTSSLIQAGRIPIDNPFAPQEIIDAESSRGIRWDRRFVEVGLQRTLNERETSRFWGGLRGTFANDWDWEASVGYGKYEQTQLRFNEINIVSLRQGLNAEVGPDGAIRCADANARANGCVPVNLFGRGSITPEAADYIRADLGLTSEVEQINVLAYTTGTLFSLPAGPFDVVLGFEYREDEMDLTPDELNRFGGHSSNFVPAFDAKIDVSEVFAEASIPLIKNVPAIHDLNMDVSFRYADYSLDKVGGVTSFGTGIQWFPVQEFNVRASFNRALRAPDLTEAFSPPRGDSDSFDDICEGVTIDSVGVIANNCRSDAGVLANIQENGAFEDESSSKFSPNAGNQDLVEESADTYTAGFVWQPSFIENLSLATDYYSIEIEDAIDSFSNAEILRQCYGSEDNFGDNNFFCQQITRDDDGQIVTLVQREQNLDSLEVSGVDTTLRYNFELSSIGLPGEYDLLYIHSHLIKHQQIGQGDDGLIIEDNKGELASGNFEDRSQLRLAWRYGNFRATWRVRYFGSINDDNDLEDDYREALANDPNAEKPFYLDIDSEVINDLFLSYRFDFAGARYRLFGGARNIFDNDGPFLPVGTSGGADNHDNIYGNIRGRYVYAGINVRF
ncbi:TonB-dependent receptor domain-containing protein [Agarilytica rhodophyticola]|uniref:TonB-dependent receptor domain-containing protein n=1 Tax=Agarilytica rhodophyticola TaxID=1737490 RepID=UPI000B3488CC|nr:TonB-dependent receptor [Agarilytica rhodophyticola]